MRVRIAAVFATLFFCVSACGTGTTQPNATGNSTPTARGSATLVTSRGTPSGRSTPRPSRTLRASRTPYNALVVVRTADSGSTVELRVDEYLRVELDAPYHQPTAQPGGAIKRTSATGGYPTGRKMVAVFRAVAPGRTDVVSSTDYACLHSTPSCTFPQQLWMIHVVVRR